MTIARKLWLGFGALILLFAVACLVIFLSQRSIDPALVAIGTLAAYLINRGIIAPVRRLRAGAEKMGRGDLDHRMDLDTTDELGTIAVAFNEMQERRQEAEGALRESEERFRGLSDASFEGPAISQDGRLLETNRSFARIFGYEPSEVAGCPPSTSWPPSPASSCAARRGPPGLRRGPLRGHRHGHRHDRRATGPRVPVLLAGGRLHHPPLWGDGPRPRHQQAARRADGRGDRPRHTLKGSSGNMGARRLGELSGALEEAGAAGDIERASGLLGRVEDEFVRVRRALEASTVGGRA